MFIQHSPSSTRAPGALKLRGSLSMTCLLLTLLPALSGCGGDLDNNYGAAAAGLAVAVAATAVHREQTGDCWGRCSEGYSCNPRSGFCEPGECDPSCSAGFSCTTTPTGSACVSTQNPAFNPLAGNVTLQGTGQGPSGTPVVGLGSPFYSPVAPSNPGQNSNPAIGNLTPARSADGQVQIPRGNPGPVGEAEPLPSAQ